MQIDPSLPSLPLNLPEIGTPASPVTSTPKRRPAATSAVKAVAGRHPSMVVVDAAHLSIDERFGMDASALANRYAEAIAAANQRLLNGSAQVAFPCVLQGEAGGYTAFTEIPLVIAAIAMANSSTSSNVTIAVIVRDAVDGEALLASVFEKQRNKSLYEKARYIAGCEQKYRNRRAWMRAEGISAEKWEPRFSKVAKIGKLDHWLLAKIDPHTISNADVAGRIVDAWTETDKRQVIKDITLAAASTTDRPINAGPLFKEIDAALGTKREPLLTSEWCEGACDLRNDKGTLVATLKRSDDGWSIYGEDLSILTRSMLATAYAAFQN